MSDNLDDLRKQIDSLDGELLRLLAKRMKVAESIGRYKKENGLELRDEARFQELLAGQLERAKTLNLSREYITELTNLIHKFSLEREEEV
jgi:chorismate mutase